MSCPLVIQAGGIICRHHFTIIREATKIFCGEDVTVLGDNAPLDDDIAESEQSDKSSNTTCGDLDWTEIETSLDFTEYGDNISNSVFRINQNDYYYKGNRLLSVQRQGRKAGITTFMLKMLPESLEGEAQAKAIQAMSWEAKFLSESTHPNIVKLQGVIGESGKAGFVIVMDRTHLSLRDKFQTWRTGNCPRMHSKCPMKSLRRLKSSWSLGSMLHLTNLSGFPGRSFLGLNQQNNVSLDQMIERLMVCHDIASAVEYLHKKKIIYRDLKPKNIGFDLQGNVRILDFSICREVSDKDLVNPPHDYYCTGFIGSRRWMAPEVYLCKPYGFYADAYSFGLMFWSIFSLKTPFEDLSIDKHFREVVRNGKRPAKLSILSIRLSNMMTRCWKEPHWKRPSFTSICTIIHNELLHLQCKDQSHTNMNVNYGTSEMPVALKGRLDQ